MQDADHALERRPRANPGVFPDSGLVEARGAVAPMQDLLVGSFEEAVGHLVAVERVFNELRTNCREAKKRLERIPSDMGSGRAKLPTAIFHYCYYATHYYFSIKLSKKSRESSSLPKLAQFTTGPLVMHHCHAIVVTSKYFAKKIIWAIKLESHHCLHKYIKKTKTLYKMPRTNWPRFSHR